MEYIIKDTKFINGLNLMVLTINGNGDGIRNNVILIDEVGNEFFVKSVAMICGNMKETTLTVSLILQKGEIGNKLYLRG